MIWRLDTRSAAALVKHTPVKGRVVRSDKIYPDKMLADLLPDFAEGRLVLDILPSYSMQI
jgi:hypothetical protein